MYDLIIVGSGPAGLSAAIYAKRAMLDTIVIEKAVFSGGQIVNTERVDNYLGLYGKSGYDLAVTFREHADKLGVQFVNGCVQKLDVAGFVKEVELEDGTIYQAKAVILATGAKHKTLGVSGENQFRQAGVSYCATCDGAFYKNQDVCCVGGGNIALEDAMYLARQCKKVYLIHRRDSFRGEKILQEEVRRTANIEFLPFSEVREIIGDDRVRQVRVENNQTGEEKLLSVSGVFLAIGMEPETSFVPEEIACDKAGYIMAGEDCRTNVAGVYAAGDVRTKPLRQLVTAVSDGAVAVHSAEHDLTKSHVE